MKYAMTLWITFLAATAATEALLSGQVEVWQFALALAVAVLLAFFRDTWRARYKRLERERQGPTALPPVPPGIRRIGPDTDRRAHP